MQKELTPLVSIETLSKTLDLPKSWLYTRTRKKEIPFVKLGRYVRFNVSEIQEYLNKNRG